MRDYPIYEANLFFESLAELAEQGIEKCVRKIREYLGSELPKSSNFIPLRMIVEDEQQAKEPAKYGKTVLKDLSFRQKLEYEKSTIGIL